MVYKIVMLLLPLVPMTAVAQNQQIKLYLQQIIANQAVMTSINKGIDIARTGLQIISAAKAGELNLHQVFFGRLSSVSPALRTDFRIQAIERMSMLVSQKSIPFNKKLLEETAMNLEELVTLLKDHRYQLTDDERMAQIEKIYEDMIDKFIFYKQF